jgi:ketosteroid isomerase-like protein
MQAPEISRMLCEVDRELIESRVRALVDLRAKGDLAAMLEYAAPDIKIHVGSWRGYPFHAARSGKEDVAELGRAVIVAYENLGSTINELLIDGDSVALHRTARIRNRGTGKTIEVEICDFLKFRDGLVVEFREYPDTAAFARLDAGV